jgi:hypothetical protein
MNLKERVKEALRKHGHLSSSPLYKDLVKVCTDYQNEMRERAYKLEKAISRMAKQLLK